MFSLLTIFSSNSDGNVTVILESPISNSTNTEDKDISSNMAQLAYYATFIVIFQFGWASTQIAHLAAIPDLSECQNERTGLTAIRYSMTVISTIMVSFILRFHFLVFVKNINLFQIFCSSMAGKGNYHIDWDDFTTTSSERFRDLVGKKEFSDVTLVCEDG